ncbi:MAG: hypothetical protein AAB472_02060 [Patescibacteria group bacterium]
MDYITRKVAHMKRFGIPADFSRRGAAQPAAVKAEALEREKRISRHRQIQARSHAGRDIEA